MRAGARRHRLIIQHAVPSIAYGGDPTWTDYIELWGSIDPLRGSEYLAARQIQSEVTGKIVVPYIPGLTPAMRVVFGTRIYQILAVIDSEEKHYELQLMVKEQIPA